MTPPHADQVIHSRAETQRPIIHHLTADNSWLIQVPRSEGPRPFFNILLDPWLAGNQIEFFQWFHEQAHTEESAFQTMAEVETFIEETEKLARKYRGTTQTDTVKPVSFVDAVALSLRGTDHTNQATLCQLPSSVPIFSNHDGAVKLVRSWKHFINVVKTPKFGGDWHETSMSPLPADIGISAIQSAKDYSDLHAGIVVAFKTPGFDETISQTDNPAECILYTPHGIPSSDVTALAQASPPVSVLAQLHGCLRVDVGFVKWATFAANLGGRAGLELSRTLHSKYWLHTHDERKVEKGLTSWTLFHDLQTVDQVAEELAMKTGESKEMILKMANYHDIGNGGSLVLRV